MKRLIMVTVQEVHFKDGSCLAEIEKIAEQQGNGDIFIYNENGRLQFARQNIDGKSLGWGQKLIVGENAPELI